MSAHAPSSPPAAATPAARPNAKDAKDSAANALQKNLRRLHKLGLRNAHDMALHLPLRYEDESELTPLSSAAYLGTHSVQVQARVSDAQVHLRPRRQLVVTLHEAGQDGKADAQLVLRFVNFQGYQLKQLAPGVLVRARGEVKHGFFGPEMIHPVYKIVTPETPLPQTLTPVYPSAEGLSQYFLRKTIKDALQTFDSSDSLPPEIVQKLGLPGFAEALHTLHQPPLGSDVHALQERSHAAWQRIKFDELLAQQLSLKRAQAERRARGAHPMSQRGALWHGLLAALPFSLTAAQQRVLDEISRDMAQDYPMQRLLQGDVGSGKTVVAALAAAQALDSGFQAALMAPTEILAEQHFRKIDGWLRPLGVQVAWLTGSLKKKEKQAAQAAAQDGSAQLLIGTHALITEQVQFARLGLALIDEQHRFGVSQRLDLRNKGGRGRDGEVAPHQLMMSATPIPRTLAMTYYADLEVSVIDELPPGRSPIVTRALPQERRAEVVERIGAQLAQGRQAYWVCPLIEESESLQLQAAIDSHAQLQEALPQACVGLVHGRMKAQEKHEVMEGFAAGRIHVLVATTVIEVGVDVPNASLMVIEHAERFGLSQLHQLRGRVGRGSAQSVCLLLYQGPLGMVARQRLDTMRNTNDGFEIARRDLELRGPGEFLGARQSGEAMLRFADLEQDQWLVERASRLAQHLMQQQAPCIDLHLARWLGAKQDFLKV
ncbi:ATP-dependent DNA helicase RecG [Massilia sp. W12]|uniref:ATP-dependent DNA helicase RecG n=1 Tax=Massilia sp. W12 TaxID=3126507 RepID=UPI0030D2439C